MRKLMCITALQIRIFAHAFISVYGTPIPCMSKHVPTFKPTLHHCAQIDRTDLL